VSAVFDGRVFSLLAPLAGGREVATDPSASDSVALSALTPPLPVLKQRPNIVDATVDTDRPVLSISIKLKVQVGSGSAPRPHQSDQLDPDPDPHQSDKLDPHHFVDDKPKCMSLFEI
jgi:hypothetical protein